MGSTSSIAIGPGGAFGTDLYVVTHASGELYRVTTSGNTTLLGDGFVDVVDLAFGPDGALYVPERINNRILRIVTAPTPVVHATWGRVKALYR